MASTAAARPDQFTPLPLATRAFMEDIRPIHLSLLQRRLLVIAGQLTSLTPYGLPGRQGWRPNLNVYRYRDCIVICADLAGIERADVEFRIEPDRVQLRGQRQIIPPSTAAGEPPRQLLALEIDDGPWHREVPLPAEIVPAAARTEQSNGLLWLSLPLRWPD